MHCFLKAIGFSQISKREEMKKIILDVIKNYDKKNVIQNYPDGTFAEFSRNYGNDCGITVCGQYDEEDRFHVEYYYPFFRIRDKMPVEISLQRNNICSFLFCKCIAESYCQFGHVFIGVYIFDSLTERLKKYSFFQPVKMPVEHPVICVYLPSNIFVVIY